MDGAESGPEIVKTCTVDNAFSCSEVMNTAPAGGAELLEYDITDCVSKLSLAAGEQQATTMTVTDCGRGVSVGQCDDLDDDLQNDKDDSNDDEHLGNEGSEDDSDPEVDPLLSDGQTPHAPHLADPRLLDIPPLRKWNCLLH